MRLTLAIAGGAVVPLVVATWLSTRIATRGARDASETALLRDARDVASYVLTWTGDQTQAVAGWTMPFRASGLGPEARQNLLSSVLRAVPSTRSVLLVDRKGVAFGPPVWVDVGADRGSLGRSLALVPRLPLAQAIAERDRLVTDGRNLAGSAVGPPYLPTGATAASIPVAAAGPNLGDEAVLGAEISLETIEKHLMQQERGQQVHGQGDQGERDEGATLGPQNLIDVVGFECEDAEHLGHMTDRQGDRDDAITVFRVADRRLRLTGQGPEDFLAQGRIGALEVAVNAPVLCRPGVPGCSRRPGRWQGCPFDSVRNRKAVGDRHTIEVEDARPLPGGHETINQHLCRLGGIQLRYGLAAGVVFVAQHLGEELGLAEQGLLAGFDQAGSPFVQGQCPAEQDQQAEQVQGQDQPAKTRAAKPDQAAPQRQVFGRVRRISSRGIGSRRHTGSRSRRTRDRRRGTFSSCA